MKTKTTSVWIVTYDGEIEVILNDVKAFKKWLIGHNLVRIEENLSGEYLKYRKNIEEVIKGVESLGSIWNALYDEAVNVMGFDIDAADNFAYDIEDIIEPESYFKIKEHSVITAIKI